MRASIPSIIRRRTVRPPAASPNAISSVPTRSVRMPRSCDIRRSKLRSMRSEPTSRMTVSASSRLTSARRARPAPRPVAARPPAFIVSEGASRVEPSAGQSPKPTPVTSARTAAKASTRRSNAAGARPASSDGISARIVPNITGASATPMSVPLAASMTDSVSSCRTIRARDAPSTARTAISWRRAAACDRSRLVTLAQVTSSNRTVAPSSTTSAVRRSPVSSRCSVVSAPVDFKRCTCSLRYRG